MTASDKWHYQIPLVHETGERRIVVVELSNDERIEAAQPMFTAVPPGSSGDDGLRLPLRNFYLSQAALAGLPPGWTVAAYDQIGRLTTALTWRGSRQCPPLIIPNY
jgi:hypothetical protein